MKHKKRRIVQQPEIVKVAETPIWREKLSVKTFLMKFFISLAIVVTSVIVLSFLLAVNSIGTRTYIGKQIFNSMEEAYAFQLEILNEADSMGAWIEQNIIISQDPPTVYINVISPAKRYSFFGDEPVPFKYGETSTRTRSITATILASLFLLGSFWFVWSKRGQRIFGETPIWRDEAVLFAIFLIPSILGISFILYAIQGFILEKP